MAEKTPITEYVYCTPDALEQDAKTEIEIRWRRKDSTERWTRFIGRLIGPTFHLELYPNVEYDLEIRAREIGKEEWDEWQRHSFRATSHAQAREYRRRERQADGDGDNQPGP